MTLRNNQFVKPWTKEEDNILINNYPSGDIKFIYSLLPHRTPVSVQQHARKVLKLKRLIIEKTRSWSKDDEKYLLDNFSIHTKDQIVKRLNRKWHTIEEYARKRGIIRTKNKQRDNLPTLQPLLEENPQAYYWLGFLLADGYYCEKLSQIVLVVDIKDKDHVDKYSKLLNTKSHVYSHPSGFNPNIISTTIRISVADKEIAEQIVKKIDWKFQKTYNPPSNRIFKNTLNKKWKFLSLLIGFIDGDGYINKKMGHIKLENHSSWITIFNLMYNRLLQCGIYCCKPKINKRGFSQINISRKHSIKQLKYFIKKYKLEVLDRKWSSIKLN